MKKQTVGSREIGPDRRGRYEFIRMDGGRKSRESVRCLKILGLDQEVGYCKSVQAKNGHNLATIFRADTAVHVRQ